MALEELFLTLKGSVGSGHWAHSGRPGKLGGSLVGSGGLSKIGLDHTSSPYERKREARVFSGDRKYPRIDDKEISTYYNFPKNCKPKDCEALNYYTTSAYNKINSALRTTGAVGSLKFTIEEIDRALDNAPRSPKNMSVYRSVSKKVLDMMTEGTVFQDKGFVSTSIDPWGNNSLEIRVPKGSKGAYIDDISHYKGEQEFLLPRGSKFQVIKNDGHQTIVELING